jgi:hypothetical protein
MSSPSTALEPKKSALPRVASNGARVLERLIALSLALLLLRSGFVHLGNPYYFLSTVYSYRMSGIEVGKWVALVVPFLQIVVAACLLSRQWVREAYGLALLMFVVFVGVQISALTRGLNIPCGCFGATENLPIGKGTLLVTGVAASAALVGWLCTFARGRGKLVLTEHPAPPTTLDGAEHALST